MSPRTKLNAQSLQPIIFKKLKQSGAETREKLMQVNSRDALFVLWSG